VKWNLFCIKRRCLRIYSPDEYTRDIGNTGIRRGLRDPNVGLEYSFKNGVNLKGSLWVAFEVGAQLSYIINQDPVRFPVVGAGPRDASAHANRLAIARME